MHKINNLLISYIIGGSSKQFPIHEPSGISITNPDRDEGSLLLNDYDAHTDPSSVKIFVNYVKSKGNYIIDADGNSILDMVSGGGHLPLGYNHGDLLKMVNSPKYDRFLYNNISFSFAPPTDIVELRDSILKPVAPHESLESAHLTSDLSGELANENAIRAAMIRHHFIRTDGVPEHNNSNCNIISFSGTNHGSTLGTLSLSTNTQKINLPMKENWTVLDFPDSEADEARALENFEDALNQHDSDVAAVIISPLQSLTYQHASNDFYNQIRNLALERGVTFIVDETHTGCGGTGSFWAHSNWNLGRAPDMVTFGRRTQVSGFYSSDDFLPEEADWHFVNSKTGDGVRLLQFKTIQESIKSHHLLQHVTDVGGALRSSLEKVDGISNVRGLGTMLAFDTKNIDTNFDLIHKLKQSGVNISAAGPTSISTKPALIFEEKHSQEFITTLKKSLK